MRELPGVFGRQGQTREARQELGNTAHTRRRRPAGGGSGPRRPARPGPAPPWGGAERPWPGSGAGGEDGPAGAAGSPRPAPGVRRWRGGCPGAGEAGAQPAASAPAQPRWPSGSPGLGHPLRATRWEKQAWERARSPSTRGQRGWLGRSLHSLRLQVPLVGLPAWPGRLQAPDRR